MNTDFKEKDSKRILVFLRHSTTQSNLPKLWRWCLVNVAPDCQNMVLGKGRQNKQVLYSILRNTDVQQSVWPKKENSALLASHVRSQKVLIHFSPQCSLPPHLSTRGTYSLEVIECLWRSSSIYSLQDIIARHAKLLPFIKIMLKYRWCKM